MASIQAVNPRFSGEGGPEQVDVENPKSPLSMSPSYAAGHSAVSKSGKNNNKLIGIVALAVIAIVTLIVVLTMGGSDDSKKTVAPTAVPALPTSSPTSIRETIIKFSPDATQTAVSAPYTATAAENLFSIPAEGEYVKVEFTSGNLENGFDVLEVWNLVDVGVEGKIPLKSLTGVNIKDEPEITTTVAGGMALKMMTDDDIVPVEADAGFIARAWIVGTMSPTLAPTNEPVPVLETTAYVEDSDPDAAPLTFTDDGLEFDAAPYGNFLLKEYTFEATKGDYAAMQFSEFDVRSYPEERDHVEVFDGVSGELLGHYNGESYKGTIVRSASMKLRIRFTVGGRGGYQGFKILALGLNNPDPNATPAPTSAVETFPLDVDDEFTHDGTNFTAVSNGDVEYADSFSRAWSFDAGAGNHAVLEFDYFDTEAGYDYLTVTDEDTGAELLKVAGSFKDGFRNLLPAQKIVIQFESDQGVFATGFAGRVLAVVATRCEIMFATAADGATTMKTKALGSTYLGVLSNDDDEFTATVGIIGDNTANKYAFPQGSATLTKNAGTVTLDVAAPVSTDGFTYTITETGLAATTDEVFMIDGLNPLFGLLYTRSENASVTADINVIKAGAIVSACAGVACDKTPSLVAYAKMCTDISKPEVAGGAVVAPVAPAPFAVSDEPFIKVVYTNVNTKKVVRDAFDNAAAKWNKLITNNFPDIPLPESITTGADLGCASETAVDLPNKQVLKGLVIYATIGVIDGPGRVLGSAGPCAFSLESGFYFGTGSKVQPRVGAMTFDESDLGGMYQDGSLNGVIAHEMGHVIGIGTTWREGFYNMLDLTRAEITPQADPRYIGANGIEGFVAIGGTAESNTIGGEDKVGIPAARTGGGGTAGGHWRETQFGSEMMSGYSAPGNKDELSMMTAKSLLDVGYTTLDFTATDEYQMPAEFQVKKFLANARPLGDDIMTFKHVGVLSSNGDVSISPGN